LRDVVGQQVRRLAAVATDVTRQRLVIGARQIPSALVRYYRPRHPPELTITRASVGGYMSSSETGDGPPRTEKVAGASELGAIRGFSIGVVQGDGLGEATTWRAIPGAGEVFAIGSHARNDLVIGDPTVSRFHCELRVEKQGVRVRDLGSRNGTVVDGVRADDAFLKSGSLVKIGRHILRFDIAQEQQQPRLSSASSFGSLVGSSVPMRAMFALLERAAATDATVLLEGETGTGKGAAAESIHNASTRRERPFTVVDCSALAPSLLESELFGYEKGAFTGADTRRIGAFEETRGGTVFLDEIGELPTDLQPKLLRVLENREVKPLGQNSYRPVDVRVIAATNRDLRGEVNAGRFRSDLYFRLAVLKVAIPPLRYRPEDIASLAREILPQLGAHAEQLAELTTPEQLARLEHSAWPGNVRELRNYLERCLVLQTAAPLEGAHPARSAATIDPRVPYADARQAALDEFERRYVEALLALHDHKVATAARAAGIARVYLYRLMQRHGLSPSR
jgi:two-component system response regulator GlrR